MVVAGPRIDDPITSGNDRVGVPQYYHRCVRGGRHIRQFELKYLQHRHGHLEDGYFVMVEPVIHDSFC